MTAGSRGEGGDLKPAPAASADATAEASPEASDDRAALSTTERLVEAVDRRLPYLFVLPALALSVGLVGYPVVQAVELSLHEVALVALDARRFVGLANYRALATDPRFGQVLWNTAVFVGASVLGQVGVGLSLALALERARLDERLRRLFRLTYVLPWATTGVVVAFSWQFMFHPQVGFVNASLRALGVANPPAWVDSVGWAMVAVVVANVWRGVPFSFVFQTSALQSVPARLTEAAAVGGASPLQSVRHVTLPLVAPFVAMNLVLVTLFTLNVFDVVYVLTGGGPLYATEVLSLHMYDTAFEAGAFGRASAVAVVLLALDAAVVALYLAVSGRRGGVA